MNDELHERELLRDRRQQIEIPFGIGAGYSTIEEEEANDLGSRDEEEHEHLRSAGHWAPDHRA